MSLRSRFEDVGVLARAEDAMVAASAGTEIHISSPVVLVALTTKPAPSCLLIDRPLLRRTSC